MKRSIIWLTLACAAPLSLAACMDGHPAYGVGTGWHSYPYDGYYDNYYGSIYDGYWGTDNFFYFRLFSNERNYRRGDRNHFRHEAPQGRNNRYRRFSGQTHQPPAGAQMPNYPGAGNRDRDRNRDRNGDHR